MMEQSINFVFFSNLKIFHNHLKKQINSALVSEKLLLHFETLTYNKILIIILVGAKDHLVLVRSLEL